MQSILLVIYFTGIHQCFYLNTEKFIYSAYEEEDEVLLQEGIRYMVGGTKLKQIEK